MSKRIFVSFVVIIAASVAVSAQAGAASTTSGSRTYVLKAVLDARHVVPAARDATTARGFFSAKLVVAGKKSSFVWTLRLRHLSGRPTRADVYFGARGRKALLALPLCVKCQAPTVHGAYNGPYVANEAFLKALLHGATYANIGTKLNPKGEIRGQITVARSA